MVKLKFNIPQYKANKFLIMLGAGKEMFGRLAFYIQVGTLIMVAVSFWDTGIIRTFSANNKWFTFDVFVFIVVMLTLIIVSIEYIFIMPASYAFGNLQFNKHQNELTDNVRELKSTQLEHDKMIKEIYKKIMGSTDEKTNKNDYS